MGNLHGKSETMQPIKLPKAETEMLQEIVVKLAGPCSIYVFGYREAHFYILVICDVSVTATHLMNEISEQTKRTVSATVLLHKPRHLKTKGGSQECFFDQVFRNGQRLCLDKANVPYILNHNPQRDLESDIRFWHKCVAVAQFNIQTAKESPQAEVTLCRVALLNIACVQLALGLIRIFMGYSPNEFGLNYLLQLCGYFTDLPSQVFDRETPEAVKRYKMLCAPPGMLIHWTRLNADESDFEILLDNCQRFLDGSAVLVATELELLNTN